ncbi:MAG: DUF3990 domain-containing protein [Pseudobutyrivibrio sp.]|uniref:DUF3990 domain-containing protein n=1 Tax=Pseudobutyrivibrio sp. TaxID=2014367 RepID=UPI0025FF7041|nr:DUF3990 domain-containing protein [Pseudobutyrivibrio sp.]MBQ6462616.1 DUF3990 domain-containing protein [Pseudobutyrivibrio sp.]MBQ8489875.1 DUF3990 domain-containing protein [Pseudobutyrivibrio sp.]
MILYHGSNVDIKNISLSACRPNKDFGRGFYLTDIPEQAERMAERVSRIYGGNPVLNIYEIEDSIFTSSDLNIKDFGLETSEEWARFVMNNRNRDFSDYSSLLCNLDSKFDIVIGPVADDNMAMLFRQYENEVIDFDTLLRGMIYKKTSSQYSFHTEKAISLLRKVSYE